MENPAKHPLQPGSVQPSQEESRSPAFPAEVCKHLSIHKPFARESSCDPASQSSPGRWGLQEPPAPTRHGLCVTSSSSGNIRWGGGVASPSVGQEQAGETPRGTFRNANSWTTPHTSKSAHGWGARAVSPGRGGARMPAVHTQAMCKPLKVSPQGDS